MGNNTDRRIWIKQMGFALAGFGLAPDLLAAGRPGNGFTSENQILLNSNENAYGPSPLAKKAILENYLYSNRYPDPLILELKKKLSTHWRVGVENILMGAGASEIIGLSSLYVAAKKGKILTAEPSYRVWNDQASAFGCTFNRIPLNADRKTNLEHMMQAIDPATGMIYICNPNNPTGTHQPVNLLADFAREASKKTVVFIDEAYTEYAALESLAPLAIENKNIIVAKTFSKIYGLAGARIGYAIAHPETIRALSNFQPWQDGSLSTVSTAAAMASLDDHSFVESCREKTRASRETCYNCFKSLSLDYIPSVANFILFNIDKFQGDFVKQMQNSNIFVQYREHFGGKWCRVSIGKTEEMDQFVIALKAFMK